MDEYRRTNNKLRSLFPGKAGVDGRLRTVVTRILRGFYKEFEEYVGKNPKIQDLVLIPDDALLEINNFGIGCLQRLRVVLASLPPDSHAKPAQPEKAKSTQPEDCAGCRFSCIGGHAAGLLCRRNPPGSDGFPIVSTNSWCGEFQRS